MIPTLIDLTKQLIAIPSTKDNPKALKEILDLTKKTLGKAFTAEHFVSNGSESLLLYLGKTRPEKFKLILNVHLDVVPGTKDQFTPTEKDGKLYGRGAYDMKSGGAAMIMLFKELAEQVPYTLGLQVVTDEETGGHDGTRYQIEQGVTTDFVIAGENTGLEVRNKTKGVLWAKIQTTGTTFHAAYPWRGDNALWKLLHALEELKKKFPIPRKPVWQTTMNLAKIETTNNTFNKIPNEATAYLDFRYIPEEENTILATIQKNLPKDVMFAIDTKDSPAKSNPNHPYYKALQKEIKKFYPDKGDIVGGNGTSDVRFYNQYHTDGAELGPLGDNHHGDGEYVDIRSLENYYHILKDFLLSLS